MDETKAFTLEEGLRHFGGVHRVQILSVSLICLCFILILGGCGIFPGFDPINPATQIPTEAGQTSEERIFATCAPPCWENITPGESTEEDVTRELDRLFSEGKIKPHKKSGGVFTAEVIRGGTPLKIVLEDKWVVLIVVEDVMNPKTRVDDVIQQLGEPEAYLGELRLNQENCPCDPWDDALYEEAPSLYPNLIYPSKGLVITILVPVDTIGCVCPKTRAGLFYFFSPIALDDALNDPDHLLVQSFDLKRERIKQWHGYGSGY